MRIMNRKLICTIVALAATAQLSAGCENKQEKAGKLAVDSMAAARGRGETDLSNPEMGAKVLITLTEWKVAQSHQEIPKGQATFAIENKGTKPHEFEIYGKGGDWRSMSIPAGGSVLMSMLIDPGEYEMFSPSKDSAGVTDKSRGMSGKIFVR